LMRWKNTMGESSFRGVNYRESWIKEEYNSVGELVHELGWGLELYKRTYIYVKYGSLDYLGEEMLQNDEVWDNINTDYNDEIDTNMFEMFEMTCDLRESGVAGIKMKTFKCRIKMGKIGV